MRRVYFLLPDADITRAVVDEMVRGGIERRHIHLVANHNIALDELPEASLVESSEIREIVARGVAAGAVVGTIAGLAAMMLSPIGLTVAGGAVLALTLAGVGFGEWLATTLGIDEASERYRQFIDAIRSGCVLLIVETRENHLELAERIVQEHHPCLLYGSTDHAVAVIR